MRREMPRQRKTTPLESVRQPLGGRMITRDFPLVIRVPTRGFFRFPCLAPTDLTLSSHPTYVSPSSFVILVGFPGHNTTVRSRIFLILDHLFDIPTLLILVTSILLIIPDTRFRMRLVVNNSSRSWVVVGGGTQINSSRSRISLHTKLQARAARGAMRKRSADVWMFSQCNVHDRIASRYYVQGCVFSLRSTSVRHINLLQTDYPSVRAL
jgi:hypothetical protein